MAGPGEVQARPPELAIEGVLGAHRDGEAARHISL